MHIQVQVFCEQTYRVPVVVLSAANVGVNRPRGTPKVFELADHLPCATCLRSGSTPCWGRLATFSEHHPCEIPPTRRLRGGSAEGEGGHFAVDDYAVHCLLCGRWPPLKHIIDSRDLTSALTGRAVPPKYSYLPTTFLAPRACGPVQRLVRADLPHCANTIRSRYPQHVACEAVVLREKAAILRLMIMRFISFFAVDGRPRSIYSTVKT